LITIGWERLDAWVIDVLTTRNDPVLDAESMIVEVTHGSRDVDRTTSSNLVTGAKIESELSWDEMLANLSDDLNRHYTEAFDRHYVEARLDRRLPPRQPETSWPLRR
jgi:hypothetical protein